MIAYPVNISTPIMPIFYRTADTNTLYKGEAQATVATVTTETIAGYGVGRAAGIGRRAGDGDRTDRQILTQQQIDEIISTQEGVVPTLQPTCLRPTLMHI